MFHIMFFFLSSILFIRKKATCYILYDLCRCFWINETLWHDCVSVSFLRWRLMQTEHCLNSSFIPFILSLQLLISVHCCALRQLNPPFYGCWENDLFTYRDRSSSSSRGFSSPVLLCCPIPHLCFSSSLINWNIYCKFFCDCFIGEHLFISVFV